jgi:hypothetical protein
MTSITISPSTIAWLLGCYHKFDRLAVQRQYPSVKGNQPFLNFGSAIHDVLARLYTQPQGPHHLDDFYLHLRGAFARQPYPDEASRQHDIERADRLIRAYLNQMDDEPCTILGVERSANFPVKNGETVIYRVAARHDLLLVRTFEPNTLIVRDWKVSGASKSLTVEQQWINLVAARWAFPQYSTLILEIDSLNDDTGCNRVIYKAADLKGVHRRVTERVLEYLRDQEHKPTPGQECQWCPLQDQCVGMSGMDWQTLDLG